MRGQREIGGMWGRIGWFYLLGVLAAAQLGKMSALMPLIGRDLELGLTAAALAISLLEIGGAVLGRVAGGLVERLGRGRTLLGGLALLAVAGIGESAAGGAGALIAWRGLEGLGYLGVVIAAPLLILETAGPAQRPVALALWTSFVPVGLALGAMASGAAADILSWRGALLGNGLGAAAALAATLALVGGVGAGGRAGSVRGRPGARAWALTLGFGCYTGFQVGELALLPIFLVEQAGSDPGGAGLVTGIASAATVAGSVFAAWSGHRGHRPLAAMAVAILVPAGLLFLVFRPAPALVPVAVAAIVLNAISGVVPALAFPMLARIAGAEGGMAAATGLLTQCGASGALCGPPLFAAAVAWGGWPGAALAGAAAATACLGLMTLAGR